MAHVFIVNETTLKVHLEYLFAGTGAQSYNCDFLNSKSNLINPNIERMLTSMIADISRIRKGDDVLFYVQRANKHEGMFFGSLKVVEEPFLCQDKYLEKDLEKKLTFRVKLKPDKIYRYGITERECLDSLKGVKHPSELCWSLIYRKLKANRGCTMITNYEYQRIMQKLDIKNNHNILKSTSISYDKEKNEIIPSQEIKLYEGKKDSLDILKRLIYKKNKKNAYESHLQAFILQNLENISALNPAESNITWIGNEVSCGVGMQSIDICFFAETLNALNIIVCELKDEQPNNFIKNQLNKYIEWLIDYIVPTYNKKVIIYPTIIAPVPTKKTTEMFENINDTTNSLENNVEVKNIRYIAFSVENDTISFKEVLHATANI